MELSNKIRGSLTLIEKWCNYTFPILFSHSRIDELDFGTFSITFEG